LSRSAMRLKLQPLGSEFEALVFGVGVMLSDARFRQLVFVRSGACTGRIALVLAEAAVARSANCADAQGGTVEAHGSAKFVRDFC
jgi:hypothetical protein